MLSKEQKEKLLPLTTIYKNEYEKLINTVLPKQQAKCYRLYYIKNMKTNDIANLLKINQITVCQYISYADEKMKSYNDFALSMVEKANEIYAKKVTELNSEIRTQKIKLYNEYNRKEHVQVDKYIDYDEVGKRLKMMRKEKKLLQKDVAKIIGVDCRILASIEHGNPFVKMQYIVALANLYQTSVNYIINGDCFEQELAA